MNSSPSTEFTASDGRRFAFPVATAFTVLAAVLLWRDREVLAAMGLGLAAALYLAGALVPARLGPVHGAWMALAGAISKVTTPIFMAVVYFGVLTPTGLARRAFGRNSLVHTLRDGSYWVESEGRSDLRRQF